MLGDSEPEDNVPPAPPAMPSRPPALPQAATIIAGPTGPGGSSGEVKQLQKELRELREKYETTCKEVEQFKFNEDESSVLNLKTRRIYDLQDQIKALQKQMQGNPDAKKLRQELEQKDKAIEEAETEKNNLITYYNDLKQKYEQIYQMIQERDQIIGQLQALVQERDEILARLQGTSPE